MPRGVYPRTEKQIQALKEGRKLSPANKKGYRYSKRQKRGGLKKGTPSPYKGIKGRYTKETIKKMSEAQMGEKSHCWKNGISREPYSQDWTNVLRESIRIRDKYICQLCGIHEKELKEEFNKKLAVHHIDYNKNNCNPINLVSLCKSCHSKTNYNRDYWKSLFKKIYGACRLFNTRLDT